MLNIQPIKLLSGSHSDTATTGSGCFMNVIAYLNGEPQITDQSPCVCPTIRPIAIWLNDYMDSAERSRLLPFVLRAMGTATDDEAVINARLAEVVRFAGDMASIAQKHAAATFATRAAATFAARAARREIVDRSIQFMEAVCPPLSEPDAVVVQRANRLVELATVEP